MSAHSAYNLAIESEPKTYSSHREMRRAVAVCTHPALDGTDLALLHVLAENANEKGYGAHPGNRMLQAACRLSERGVQYRLKKLIECGLAERTECPKGGSGLAAVYRICLESPWFPTWEEVVQRFEIGKKTPQDEVRGSGENVAPATPQPILRGSIHAAPQRERETPQSGEKTPQPCIATHLKDHLKEQVENKGDGAPPLFSTNTIKKENSTSFSHSQDSASRAGKASRQRLNPRLERIVRFYVEGYEKRNKRSGAKAVVKQGDMDALEEMLSEQPKVQTAVICAWMNEAFDCGKFPFGNGIVSLANFAKRYKELDLSNAETHSIFDTRFMGRTYASLTQKELFDCEQDILIIMPHDCPPDDHELSVDGRPMTFKEVFGDERKFFRPTT